MHDVCVGVLVGAFTVAARWNKVAAVTIYSCRNENIVRQDIVVCARVCVCVTMMLLPADRAWCTTWKNSRKYNTVRLDVGRFFDETQQQFLSLGLRINLLSMFGSGTGLGILYGNVKVAASCTNYSQNIRLFSIVDDVESRLRHRLAAACILHE